MKTLLLALGAVLLLTTPATGPLAARPRPAVPAPHALTPDEQLFTGLLEQVGAAISKGDTKTLGQYMTTDYVHYSPDGGSATKAAELAYLGTWKNSAMKLVSPVKVVRQGDMAVTVATSTFSGVAEGQDFKNTIQMMVAWVLREGHWQMAVVQSKVMKG